MLHGDESSGTVLQRFEGYHLALDEYGIPEDDRIIQEWPNIAHRDCETGYRSAKALLEKKTGATAIFCTTISCRRRDESDPRGGAAHPERYGSCGIRRYPDCRVRTRPRLTTVAQPVDELGCRAAELLFSKLKISKPTSAQDVRPEAHTW